MFLIYAKDMLEVDKFQYFDNFSALSSFKMTLTLIKVKFIICADSPDIELLGYQV